jgi:hypothetical protein
MDKIAMIKQAEVNGVLAALVEKELVKVADDEDFEALTGAIAGSLSEDYDFEEVMDKTAAVMEEYYELVEGAEGAEGEEGHEKEAGEEGEAEYDERDIMAAYGELTLAKEAGDISEEDFEKEAAKVQQAWEAIKKAPAATGRFIRSGAKGEGVRSSAKNARFNSKRVKTFEKKKGKGTAKGFRSQRAEDRKDLAKALGRSGAVYGGAAGTGVAGKKLYEKYKGE